MFEAGKDFSILKNIRIAQTVSYFIAFVALGLAMASLGPTLPALAEQTRASVGEISYLFTVRSFGFLLGSLFGGRLYDRLRGHHVMVAIRSGCGYFVTCDERSILKFRVSVEGRYPQIKLRKPSELVAELEEFLRRRREEEEDDEDE